MCMDIPYSGIPLGICLCGWPATHISKSQMLTVYELQRFKVCEMFDIVTCVVFKVESRVLDMIQI